MSLVTPRNNVRRLTFSPASNQNPFSKSLQSPYTPFSGRKSGSAPLSTPRFIDPEFDDSLPPEPSVEAQRYIDGDLAAVLRGAAIDTITASRKITTFAEPAEKALAYVSQLIATLDIQLDLSEVLAHAPSQRPHIRRNLNTINAQLRLERDTWLLLQTLWRHPEMPSDDLSTRRLAPDPSHANVIQTNPGHLKLQRIVEWLERTADAALQRSGGPHLKPLDDPAYRWEYTAARDHDSEPISMDAPCQGVSLDEIEKNAEERLSREVYRLVRAGRLDEAEEVCRLVGQPWRAAAIAGGKRGSALASNGVKGLARKSWRKAATAVATSTDRAITAHERAVCGLLAGVLDPVLSVAESYNDELWARTSILLEIAAENVLSVSTPPQNIEDEAILQAFNECQSAGRGVSGVNADLLEGLRKVQSFIGLGESIGAENLKLFLETLAKLSRTGLLLGTEWACRFSAQICLFLKFSGLMSVGDLHPEMFEYFDTAVQSYVQLVIKMDFEEEQRAVKQRTILPARPLVSATASHFLAELSDGRRTVDTYSELLCAALRADLGHEQAEAERAGVETREIEERRILCFKKAGQCFTRETLDAVMVAAIDKIWQENMPSVSSGPTTRIEAGLGVKDEFTAQDELVMRAIEFLLFPEFANYEEALQRVTSATRLFFLVGKRKAARNSIIWFPKKALEYVSPDVFAKLIHEFDCWSAYFDALKKHAEWNNFYSSKRPRALPEHIRTTALAQPGQASYNDQASAKLKLQEYIEELEEFQRVCEKYRDAAISSLRAALLFSGGWMHDIETVMEPDEMEDTDDDDMRRKVEVKAVRMFGVPQLAMLLHHVLDESMLFADAVELANLVADEECRIYDSFGVKELKAFLARIADSSVRLAASTVHSGETTRPYEGNFFEEIV